MIRILTCGEVPEEEIFDRSEPTADVSDIVSDIIAQVRERGDEALRDYTTRFDGVEIGDLRVSDAEMDAALEAVDDEFLGVLSRAADNIRTFHMAQARLGFRIEGEDGIVIGQKVMPIERVGIYVPGGTAAYPSTVLMDAIPAKVAGCPRVVMVTPPSKDGTVNAHILAAAHEAGIDEIYKVGGAQAIAALAYGTQSIPCVYKIVGPGNAFVAEAKRQVFGRVSIDMIAGPSEILVIADAAMDPRFVAADLLSQAEHDRNATAVLVTDSPELAVAVQEQIEIQVAKLERAEIARASIDNNGKIIVADDLRAVIDIANRIAPEHLELCVDNPFDYLEDIHNAGSVFLGRNCPEALGDYFAGPNHTLPTSGSARFSSPLSVDEYIKKSQFIYYTPQALAKVADDVALFATREGLTGHAESAVIRTREG